MGVKGVIKDGKVVLDETTRLPEGMIVEVVPLEKRPLSADFLKFSGAAKGDYPADFAANHDHYIHGTTKNEH